MPQPKTITAKQFQAQHTTRRGAGLVSSAQFRKASASGIMTKAEFVECGLGKESALQIACVSWFRTTYPHFERLLVASLNGVELKGGPKQWIYLLKMGAVAGESDTTLKIPSGDYGYLDIEFKTKKGKQSAKQKEMEKAVIAAGGGYVIVRSKDQFIRVVEGYLETGNY